MTANVKIIGRIITRICIPICPDCRIARIPPIRRHHPADVWVVVPRVEVEQTRLRVGLLPDEGLVLLQRRRLARALAKGAVLGPLRLDAGGVRHYLDRREMVAVVEEGLHRAGADALEVAVGVFMPGLVGLTLGVAAEVERGLQRAAGAGVGRLGQALAVRADREGRRRRAAGDGGRPVLPAPGEAAAQAREHVAVAVIGDGLAAHGRHGMRPGTAGGGVGVGPQPRAREDVADGVGGEALGQRGG